ncbi:MAG: DUF434 domain-containing protein [Planctomycetes bacterium]|nr:DUF434 domain-containing protein [Planctomycetota bacterium]
MPDRRKHRGSHPDDTQLFAPDYLDALRTAVAEYSWLLTRAYAPESALKLVGDRYALTVRQRTGVRRSACSDQMLTRRRRSRIGLDECRGKAIGIDGYNLLITIESALSGGLIIIGRDGCYRDLASVHGTYRKVEETVPAVELIADHLAAHDVSRVDWYLDRPVSNSGRVKVLMAEVLEDRASARPSTTQWNIELVTSPDRVLMDFDGPIVSSDSVILDRGGAWVNLATEIVDAHISSAWTIDLRDSAFSEIV